PRLGARVLLCGPPQLLPETAPLPQASAVMPLDAALPFADAVMCLRIQHERHNGNGHLADDANDKSSQSFLSAYGLTEARLARARPHCVIMHPGPVNRDVELEGSLIEHPRSLILEQVQNGLYIRMAVMEWIAGVLP